MYPNIIQNLPPFEADDYEYDDDDSNSADDEPSSTKIQPHESTQKRSLFIQQKYKSLAFVKMPKSKTAPDVFDSIKKQLYKFHSNNN